MKSLNQIFQYHFRLGRHTFIKRLFTHVAIYHPFLTESTKIGISRIFTLQYIIRESPVETIDNTPIVGTFRLAVHCFEVERDTSRSGDRLSEIIGTCITKRAVPENFYRPRHTSCPRGSLHEHHRTLLYMGNPFFQFIIMLFYGCKFPVAVSSSPMKSPINLIHSAVPERSHLFVSQMRHQRNAHFTHGIVSAALERKK